MADSKVIHPAPKYRVDQLYNSTHRLRLESPEDFLELAQKRRPFLQLWRIVRSPSPSEATDATKVKAQKSEAPSRYQVHLSALLHVDLDLKSGQFFPQSSIHRFIQPAMLPVGIHQDHQSSSAGDSHPHALTEPDVTVARHPALRLQPQA